MATTSLQVIISAKDQFSGTANKVIGSLNRMDSAAGRVGKGVGQMASGFARVAAIAATAAVGGLTLVAKKTIDWESALAGVNKTMDLTGPELQGMGTDIRRLATQIPLAATEIAGLVEQAGALGIAKGDVLAFAKATATIGVTTNVSADQAAVALGGLSNLLGLTGKDFERFSSSLVDLGNKGASFESEIIELASRAAGAAATIGLSAEQLLGWSAAISNIRMAPDAAGTAFQTFALEVQKFTRSGGDELKVLAATAGTTAKEFARAFEEDASGALESFINGLAKLSKGKRADVLEALGFSEARLRRMLLGLAVAEENVDNVSKSLDISAEAWKANTAAAEEADKRYGTVASKLQLLNNQFTEATLLIGEGFLPALGRVADKLKAALGDESVRNDLRDFGKQLGSALDGIDWDEVISGAKEFVGVLRESFTWGKRLFDLVNLLPGPLKAAGVSFLALNKLSGGLIGAGAGNIIGGLGRLAFGATGGAGSLGKLFAQPVFVTNWAMMAGGGLGAPGAAGKLGGIFRGALSFLPAAIAVGIAAELKGVLDEQGERNRQQAADLIPKGLDFAKTATTAAIENSLKGLRENAERLNRELSPEGFAYQFNVNGVRDAIQNQIDTLAAELDRRERGGAFTPSRSPQFGGLSPDDRDARRRSAPPSQPIFGPPAPVFEDDPRLVGIIDRAKKAGRQPTDLYASAMATLQRNIARELAKSTAAQERAAAAAERAAAETAKGTAAFQSMGQQQPPIVNVDVHVTAGGIVKTVTTQNRAGPPNGSRGQDTRHFNGGGQ